jgi:ABC transport system ATP-binding/permease protein
MHYLSVENLTKSYGVNPLFRGISFHISEGDKIALVARNGSGKSTLLKILSGQESKDDGTVWIHKDLTVALFEQNPVFEEKKTIGDNIFQHDHPVLNAIKNYEAVQEEEDMERLGDAIVLMDDMNAWDFEVKVKMILGKLNIHHLSQPLESLSGGERKRVALARTLIDIGFEHQHTLLIMDEPTNHLDVEMIEWLEYYLNQEHITLLMVSHDRYFLDAVCTEIWEMDGDQLHFYKGDYANFMEKKAARIESENASIDKARNLYRRELEWMRKQPKARTTKSKSRQDAFYEVEERAKKRMDEQRLELNVKMSRLGGKIAELKKVYKSYDHKKILTGFDYTFRKGDRVGVIGKNGVGKTTFLNLLQEKELPDSGKINIGDTVVFGYYSQQGLIVKEDKRVIEFVKDIAENFPLADGSMMGAAQFLNLFLFPPEKQFTYISKLSGGEKRRLHLLSILFRNPNFLVLDEPTNDLDLPTLGVLENFLSDFQGCVLIVSHDRYFMDRLVDHLFVFEGDGVVSDFPGNYSQYRIWVKDQQLMAEELASKQNSKAPPVTTAVAVSTPATPVVAKPKLSFKEKREFELLEAEMPRLDKERSDITARLNSGELDYEALQKITHRITEITQTLDEMELRWLELSERAG